MFYLGKEPLDPATFEPYFYKNSLSNNPVRILEPVNKHVIEPIIHQPVRILETVDKHSGPVDKHSGPIIKKQNDPITHSPVGNPKPVLTNRPENFPKKKARPPSLIALISDKRLETINDEMTEQMLIATYYEKNPAQKKAWKQGKHRLFNADIDEIMTDLMSADVSNKRFQEGRISCFGRIHTNLAIIIALTHYYKKTVVVIDETRRTYVPFPDTNPCYDVWIRFDPLANRFEKMDGSIDLEPLLEMHDYRKPLKALSYYKKEELEEIAKKFLFEPKKADKKSLADALQNYCFGIGTVPPSPTGMVQLMDYVSK